MYQLVLLLFLHWYVLKCVVAPLEDTLLKIVCCDPKCVPDIVVTVSLDFYPGNMILVKLYWDEMVIIAL